MKKKIKTIVKIPKGYVWTLSTKLSKNRIECVFELPYTENIQLSNLPVVLTEETLADNRE